MEFWLQQNWQAKDVTLTLQVWGFGMFADGYAAVMLLTLQDVGVLLSPIQG